MGADFGEAAENSFSFPPSRPMHLPPAHPVGEASRGAICAISCPGRRGDEDGKGGEAYGIDIYIYEYMIIDNYIINIDIISWNLFNIYV